MATHKFPTAPLARILLRYGAAAAVSVGWLRPDFAERLSTDPDVVVVVGLLLGLGVELTYALARRLDWDR